MQVSTQTGRVSTSILWANMYLPLKTIVLSAPADGPQPLGDFFTADLNGGYTSNWKIPVRFYIRVKNLTNKIYSTVNGYPDFGRMVFGGISIKFKGK